MEEPKAEEFLDDIDQMQEAEDALEEELIDITQEDAQTDEVDELAAVTAERDEYRDRFMRALADAENSRKRADKDRREAENYGGSKMARDLLPVYDNMKRAVEAAGDEQKEAAAALIEGVELTMRELLNVFKKHGIQPISPQVGDRFDPQLHQAMFEAPLPGTKAGDIIQVSAEGFMLHDRLLRPSQVGVSSTPCILKRCAGGKAISLLVLPRPLTHIVFEALLLVSIHLDAASRAFPKQVIRWLAGGTALQELRENNGKSSITACRPVLPASRSPFSKASKTTRARSTTTKGRPANCATCTP